MTQQQSSNFSIGSLVSIPNEFCYYEGKNLCNLITFKKS